MKTAAIIVAGGRGERFGGELPKQYLCLQEKPILAHTLLAFEGSCVDGVVLVVNGDKIQFCQREIVNRYQLTKVKAIVSGGRDRQESVYNGFKAIEEGSIEVVVVHDGIRPFVSVSLIEEVAQEALRSGAAIVAIPVKDTVKLVSQEGIIRETIERKNLWLAQTPQAFRYELLREGFERLLQDESSVTDEAMMIERLGYKVRIIRGSEDNIKITTSQDLLLAEAILAKRYYTDL